MKNPSKKPIVIAIDGPSASGKGTLAKRLAEYFDFAYLDTGLLYRAIGALAEESDVDIENEREMSIFAKNLDSDIVLEKIKDPVLRRDHIAKAGSKVAINPQVRGILLKIQRDFLNNPPGGKKGAVLDGRDIGTVVAPDATVKIFVTASLEARAKRRFKELQERGENVSETAILADMRERDTRDQVRDIAPAKPAPDAIMLDTTNMGIDEVFEKALSIAEEKIASDKNLPA